MLLEIESVIYIHDKILEASGGLAGLRDRSLLASAIDRTEISTFGIERYKTIHAKAAAILEAIALFHPFIDGNKRTAMAAADYYLFLHDINLVMTNIEYEEFMLKVVKEKLSVKNISEWLEQHTEPLTEVSS